MGSLPTAGNVGRPASAVVGGMCPSPVNRSHYVSFIAASIETMIFCPFSILKSYLYPPASLHYLGIYLPSLAINYPCQASIILTATTITLTGTSPQPALLLSRHCTYNYYFSPFIILTGPSLDQHCSESSLDQQCNWVLAQPNNWAFDIGIYQCRFFSSKNKARWERGDREASSIQEATNRSIHSRCSPVKDFCLLPSPCCPPASQLNLLSIILAWLLS